MSKYHVRGQDNVVFGSTMLQLLDQVHSGELAPVLADHGFDDIDPDTWYPMQMYLDVFNLILERRPSDATSDFVSLGMKILDNAVFPPEFDSMAFTDIMLRWNDAYQLNNRGSEAGGVVTEVVSPTHLRFTLTTPFPDDFNYGVFYAAARRFLPKRSVFSVSYDDTATRRDYGGSVSVFHVKWTAPN